MLIVAASLTGCRPKSAISRPPTSIESLCLVGAPIARTFKLPGIDTMRNDRMLKGQELHVDIDAAERIAVAATHEIAGNVNQAAQGTAQVSTNILGTTEMTGKVGTAAAQVLDAASELSGRSDRLKQEVENFLSAVRAA
jgi:hypothetical protein